MGRSLSTLPLRVTENMNAKDESDYESNTIHKDAHVWHSNKII